MDSITIPPIFCPFLQMINPHIKGAQQHVLEWAQRFRLIQKEVAQQRFKRADFGGFAACTYPGVDADGLNLVSDWFAWLFLVDDQLDDGTLGIQPEKVQKVMSDFLAVIDGVDRSENRLAHAFAQSSVAVTSLADLWLRTYPGTQPAWRKRFSHHFADCFAAASWEAQNRIQGVIPSLDIYRTKRRDTGAIYICLDLIDVINKIDLPVQIYNHPVFQTLLDTASNVIGWCNDVFSLEKERERGEYHNLVLVIQQEKRSTLQEAINDACELTTAEVQRFLQAEQQLQGLFPVHAQDIQTYLNGMKSWMRGNLDWSSATKRYTCVEKIGLGSPINYLEMIMESSQVHLFEHVLKGRSTMQEDTSVPNLQPASGFTDLGKEFAPFSPVFATNRYPFYARARQQEAVFFSPSLNLWVISSFKDAIAVLKDHQRFSIVDENPRAETYTPEVLEILSASPLLSVPSIFTIDPPEHTRLRNCTNKALTAQRVASVEPRIRNLANQLIDRFEHAGRADFIAQFARAYPAQVIGSLMDVPESDLNQIQLWSEDMMTLYFGDAPAEQQPSLARSTLALHQYFYHLAERSQMAPQDDLAGDLFRVANAGEAPLSVAEVGHLLLGLLGAGIETSAGFLGNCLYHLLAERTYWQAILEDPGSIPAVVEEALRLDMPAHGPLRRTTEAIEVSGKIIPKGALVQVMLDSANHDETLFPEPETFDPHREKLHRHIGFGHGVHYCVGAPLARLKTRVALEQLRERLPSLRLVPDQEFSYTPSLALHGLKQLLIEWDHP